MNDFTRKTDPRLRHAMEIVKERMADYTERDYIAERARLVETWRRAHPECVNQPASLKHHTLDKVQDGVLDDTDRPEVWQSDIYQITLRRWSKDPVFGSNGGMIQLGINTLDGTARHDWREFQAIKNQLAGPECEAFELYPAEERLLDPSNYYTLWCFPGIRRIKVGINERRVFDADEAWAPQREFEKNPKGA